jgi:hypothetical protein
MNRQGGVRKQLGQVVHGVSLVWANSRPVRSAAPHSPLRCVGIASHGRRFGQQGFHLSSAQQGG